MIIDSNDKQSQQQQKRSCINDGEREKSDEDGTIIIRSGGWKW